MENIIRYKPLNYPQKVLKLHRFSKTTIVLYMKYPAFLAIFFILTVRSAMGQLTLGARGGFGISASSLELNRGVTREIGSSPIAGLIIHYNFDQKFSVGTEVNYSKFSESIIYSDSNTRTETGISYIQVPITGRASIGDKKYRGFVELGVYAGFGFQGSWKNGPNVIFTEVGQNSIPSDIILDKDYTLSQNLLQKLDVGGLLGGGVEYKLNNTSLLFFEARIQMGFFNFYKISSETRRAYLTSKKNYVIPDASWRAVNFSVGYLRTFKLPKFAEANKRAGKQKRGA